MTLLCSSSFTQHSISFLLKRMFVDAVGGWRPSWMKDSAGVGDGSEEGGSEVSSAGDMISEVI